MSGDGTYQPRVYSDVLSRYVIGLISGVLGIRVQGIDADGAAATADPVIVGGVDGSGNVQQFLTDTSGVQTVSQKTGTWTPATAAAPADSAVITAAATTVRRVLAANSHATTTVYLQLFDLAAVPANGVAPRVPSIPIAAGQTILLELGALACANGWCWASSSTVATKTVTNITPLQVSAEIG